MNLLLQKLLPHFLVTWLIGKLAHCQNRLVKNSFIKGFIRYHKVDMQLAEQPDYRAYNTFSAFFTRAIKSELRPVTAGELDIASPVDGTTSEFGTISQTKLLQAKGLDYQLIDLIGGDNHLVRQFENGNYATFYLSPRDYHRVHMPFSGTLRSITHIPGKLFSVSPSLTSILPNVYVSNERAVFRFDSAIGPFLVVLVGAMGVGSIATSWAGAVTNHSETETSTVDYPATGPQSLTFERGQELGYFDMGSTVIVVFPPIAMELQDKLQLEGQVKMGEKIASFVS